MELDGSFVTYYASLKMEPHQINAKKKRSLNTMSSAIVDLVQNGNTVNGQYVQANVEKELNED